jgi:hypothetical protein
MLFYNLVGGCTVVSTVAYAVQGPTLGGVLALVSLPGTILFVSILAILKEKRSSVANKPYGLDTLLVIGLVASTAFLFSAAISYYFFQWNGVFFSTTPILVGVFLTPPVAKYMGWVKD